jgi:hypothetical protein
MPLAIDERKLWEKNMRNGFIPDEVKHALNIYRKQREDPCWRATRMFEALGEAALLWEESILKGESRE